MRLLTGIAWAGWFGLWTGACSAADVTAEMLDQVQMGMSSTQVHDLLNVPLQNDCTPLDLGKVFVYAKVCISERDRVYEVFWIEKFPAWTNPYQLLNDAIKQEEAKIGPPLDVSEWTFGCEKTARWGSSSASLTELTVLFSGSAWDDDDVYLQKTRDSDAIIRVD